MLGFYYAHSGQSPDSADPLTRRKELPKQPAKLGKTTLRLRFYYPGTTALSAAPEEVPRDMDTT